jgi:hypothetical protein
MVKAVYLRRKLTEKNLYVTPREYLTILRDAKKRENMDMDLSEYDELALDFFKGHKKAVSRLISKVNASNASN